MASLNFVDIILIIILLTSVIVGFGRGFFGEFVSLVFVFVAFFVAIYFTVPLADQFTSSPSVQSVVNQAANSGSKSVQENATYFALALSFAILFIGTLFIGAILRFFLNLAFQGTILGFGNRLLGALFGFVRGYLLNLVIIFIVQLTTLSSADAWKQSYFVQFYQPQVQWLASQVSPTLANIQLTFSETLHQMAERIRSMVHY